MTATGPTWTLSNGLSLLRALIAVPVAFLLLDGSSSATMWAAALIVTAAATDYLDGYSPKVQGVKPHARYDMDDNRVAEKAWFA